MFVWAACSAKSSSDTSLPVLFMMWLQLSVLRKYSEMLNSGATESQVRLRMVNDRVPPAQIDMFLGASNGLTLDLNDTQNDNSSILGSSPGSANYLSPKQGSSSRVYARLLANGVPAATVRQKMARNGLDITEINKFFADLK